MSEPDSTGSVQPVRRAAERRLHSRALGPALLLSAALHFAALYFIGFRVDSERQRTAPPPRLLRIVPTMQAYDIAVVDVTIPDVRAPVEEPRVAELPVTVPSGAVPAAAPLDARAPLDPSLERLRYRSPRADVWRRSDPPPRSDEEMVRERVAAQINAYNDSVAAEAGAAMRATDWTVKDGDGGRWGVSPGAIHLGSVTLPLPFAFSAPPGRREEVAGRLTNWTAIQQQATIVEGREIVKDRIKAIEQRKAAERAARQNPATTPAPGGTSGGSSGGTTSGTSGSSGGGPLPRGGS
jgi:hypothetical protein